MSDGKLCPTCGTEYPLSERFCPRDGTALRAANAQADLLGSIVADRYHIIKKLGEGGMGTVYLAEHVKMGRKSALKVMNPGMNADPDAIARFNREASNASRLSHPNICGIYDFGETPDGLIYLAMEFIEGKPLTDLIEEANGLAPARAASIVHQAADALQIAHDAGIVHRDLKPDNIMVARNRDGSDLVKVVDFGIAKASSSDAQKVTKTGLVVGTPEYMSPEQLAGDKLDGRSDIYSLALVAFNCLTGTLPFPSQTAQEAMIMRLTDRPRTLTEMRPDRSWPAEVESVMERALARDAEQRYQSAAQFGRDFAAALQAMPSVAATEGATMVIGAQGAVDAASAPTKAIPATRVAGRDESNAPARQPGRAAAAAEPEKKSSMMPMAVGGVVVVIAAVIGYTQFAGKGATTEPTPTVASAPAVDAASQNAAPSGPVGGEAGASGSNTTQMNQPMPSGSAAPRQPAGQQSAPTPSQPATPGGSPDAGENTAATIRMWRNRIENAPEADAETIGRSAARILESVLPNLTGLQRDDATYVLMLAAYAMNEPAEICKYVGPVISSRLGPDEKQLARTFKDAHRCQ